MLGRNVPLDRQWGLFNSVRETAVVVFGATGVWLSLLQPQLLRRFFERESDQFSGGELRSLLVPLLIAGSCAAVDMLTPIVVSMLAFTPGIAAIEIRYLQGISGLILGASSAGVLAALSLTISPGVRIGNEFEALVERERLASRLKNQAQQSLHPSKR